MQSMSTDGVLFSLSLSGTNIIKCCKRICQCNSILHLINFRTCLIVRWRSEVRIFKVKSKRQHLGKNHTTFHCAAQEFQTSEYLDKTRRHHCFVCFLLAEIDGFCLSLIVSYKPDNVNPVLHTPKLKHEIVLGFGPRMMLVWNGICPSGFSSRFGSLHVICIILVDVVT